MLVVDVDALGLVDPLDLVDDVQLGVGAPADVEPDYAEIEAELGKLN